MGLFNKLKEILFDEETVEIPVITKEEKKKPEKTRKEDLKKAYEEENKVKTSKRTTRTKSEDEVIIKKIETPKREVISDIDEFDMPKLKTEEPPAKEEKKINTFTFPIFEDDDKSYAEPKRKERTKSVQEKEKPKRKSPEAPKAPEKRNLGGGYTNAYDYSYGKYKGDYMSNRISNQPVLEKTVTEKEERKAFVPSPIISPVYGVLNENYKKEDIKSKKESTSNNTHEFLDLDSVRRKAYGTLEEEIEVSLGHDNVEFEEKIPDKDTYDDGISIDDLLVDHSEEEEKTEQINEPIIVEDDDMELFKELSSDDDDDAIEEIELNDKNNDYKKNIRKPDFETENRGPKIPEDAEEIKIEKNNMKKENVKEEDLFDLIDSLYEDGKGDE